jgi:hypothetical protein
MQYIISRAKEPSTWRWALVLASMAGANIAPDMQEAIVMVGVGAAGLIGMAFPDSPKK